MLQPAKERLSRQDSRPRRRELDRQRQAVKPSADLDNRGRVVGAQLKQRVDAFAAATQRIGDEVAALKPPENAIAANTELAQGLRDIAAGTRAASAKIAKLKTAKAGISYLEHSKGPVKGSHEISSALAELQKLGYTTTS